MVLINLNEYVNVQVEYFIEKFKSNGWDREDECYISKYTDLQDWDLGIVFYSELLEYTQGKHDIITPWICGRLEIETTDESKLREYAKFILDELDELELAPFHDEDAFQGYFSKEDHRDWTQLKFYINKFYPNGHWQNHVL